VAKKITVYIVKITVYIVLVVGIIWVVFPFIWIFLTSIKTAAEAFRVPPVWIFRPTIQNYVSAIRDGFLQNMFNSTIVAVASVSISIGLGAPAAYAFSRFKFVGRTHLQFFILSLYFAPTITQVIPFLVIWKSLHLLGTLYAIIVMHTLMALPLVVWVLKAFVDDIPASVEEAALIDGCDHKRVFLKITLPLIIPGLIAIAILSFIFSWNEFMFALMLAGEGSHTVPVALEKYVTPAGTAWSKMAAASILGSVIPVVFILLVQKNIIRGLSLGAVKD